MKLEKYLEEKFKAVWDAITKIDIDINGNGKEGIKTQLNNLLAIKTYNAKQKAIRLSLACAFGVALLSAFWSAGYWAFRTSVNEIVEERTAEIVEEIDRLRYEIENSEVEVIMEY